MGSGKLKTGKEQHSPADGALVAGVTGLETLGGRAGQRGVPVHTEGIVLAALLAPPTCSAAKQISGGEECSFRNNGSGFAGQAKYFIKFLHMERFVEVLCVYTEQNWYEVWLKSISCHKTF